MVSLRKSQVFSEVDWLKNWSRQGRVKNTLKSKSHMMNHELKVRMDNIYRSVEVNNVNHIVRSLDILWSYYEAARKRFVNVVCMQGVALHLVKSSDIRYITKSVFFKLCGWLEAKATRVNRSRRFDIAEEEDGTRSSDWKSRMRQNYFEVKEIPTDIWND